jgi:ubiquinone/menaquinone biosynthesis C-methylase UbiE
MAGGLRLDVLTPGKLAVRAHFDRLASEIDRWRRKSWYYHDEIERFAKFVIPPGSSVLELGSGTGELLAALRPSEGMGVDISPKMVEIARTRFPQLEFLVADAETLEPGRTFDYVVLSDLLGHLEDIWTTLRNLRRAVHSDSRVVITYYNYLWEPVLRLAEFLQQRTPLRLQNWLPLGDIENLLFLADFEVIKRGRRFIIPKHIPFLSNWFNRIVAKLPIVGRLCLIQYVIARPKPAALEDLSEASLCSVVIPTRNERGNIAAAVEQVRRLPFQTELIFVDGASTDGTQEEIEKYLSPNASSGDVKLLLQELPRGKGDAVRIGFDAASGSVLMILDADLTVAPEDLTKFYRAIVERKGDLINGTRLVYPMERQAMRVLNIVGNKIFSALFSWTLEQRITDTLCGTKALRRSDYERIKANRAYFGDFDPFGDFDLLFGAAKLNMKIVELPIRYRERTYGTTKISRFRHGLLLLRMSVIAVRKLKFT